MFVFLWSNDSEKVKKKKKEETPYKTCILFLTGISIKEIIHFHIFTALNTDVLLLFSKDMLGVK